MVQTISEPIIQLKSLTKCYRSVKAVNDLNLNIYKGEIFGLLGPNGAGKTTTILMMLGLTDPTTGSAYVCGHNATSSPIAVKRKVGYMPDSMGFYDSMTALENLIYIGRLNGISENEIQSRAREMMEQVGLGNEMDKKTSAYSRGMKQRLGLADVLIKQPEIIILDEPTLGIDPAGVKEFLSLIKQLSRQQGLTVLLSSHHLHQVQQVCDRVGIFVEGKLLVEGNINTLSNNLFNKENYLTQVSLKHKVEETEKLRRELLQISSVEHINIKEDSIELSTSDDITPDIVRLFVQKGFDITGVYKKEYGLDEIYQKYFEKNLTENTTNAKSGNFFQRSIFKKTKAQ